MTRIPMVGDSKPLDVEEFNASLLRMREDSRRMVAQFEIDQDMQSLTSARKQLTRIDQLVAQAGLE